MYSAADDALGWIIEGGTLFAVADHLDEFANVRFDPSAHRYLQLREDGGTTFWEASPDAATWTVVASRPDPISVTALEVRLQAGTYTTVADPGIAVFGGVDVP